MTVIKVSVGLTSKVTNPRNQYENVVFSRSFGHEEPLAPRPDDPEDQALGLHGGDSVCSG